MKSTLLTVAISAITIGKLNPRKEFDETELKELSETIREQGIIQPLLLRYTDKADKYELVCGNRRLLAASAIGLKEVPAKVQEMTDDEAVEAMIVENLQRANINDIEEASAFLRLIKTKGKKMEDIAITVGKTPKYVASRLKLTDLLPEFQTAIRDRFMDVDLGLKIAVLSQETQKALWKSERCKAGEEIDITTWTIGKYQQKLSSAPFDLKDKELNKTMGACVGCPNNTASNTLLFPEMEGVGMCLLSKCFSGKVQESYNRELKKAIEDPAVILVAEVYEENAVTKALKAKGHDVLIRGYGYGEKQTYSKVEAPEVMTRTDWEEENETEIAEEWSKQETEKYWNEEQANAKKELDAYNKSIATGNYNKAFIVDGDKKGTYVYITLKKASNKTSKDAKGKKPSEEKVNVQAEIKRMSDNEKRKKELDGEKMQPLYYEALRKGNDFLTNKPMKKEEIIAGVIIAAENLSHSYKSKFLREIKAPNNDYRSNSIYKSLAKRTETQVQQCLNLVNRYLIIDKCQPGNGTSADNSNKGAVLVDIVTIYKPKESDKIYKDQMAERKKRGERLAVRIEQLKNANKKK